MGATKQPKGRGSRRQRRQAPRRVQRRQGQPAPQGQAPRRVRGSPPSPVPPGFKPGDARGEAPCMKITLISPFPGGEGGRGMGQQRQLTAGTAGDKEGKPPRRVQRRQGQPAPQGASPPPGAGLHHPSPVLPGFSRRAPAWQGLYVPQAVQCRGAGGGSPRQNNLRVSPFPGGEGGRGDGGNKAT